MNFIRESLTGQDQLIIDRLKENYGYPLKKHNRLETWIVDRENGLFLVKVGGNGYHNKEEPGVFVYGTPEGMVRIEADYKVAGRSMEGCGAYWNVTRIEAPAKHKEQKDLLLCGIHIAFRTYGIGFEPAIIDEFKLQFLCEPEFE
jgi:hypothetical protein